MSRRSRRSLAEITGVASAKRGKRLAKRGVRQRQHLALKTCAHDDSLLLGHPLVYVPRTITVANSTTASGTNPGTNRAPLLPQNCKLPAAPCTPLKGGLRSAYNRWGCRQSWAVRVDLAGKDKT